MIKYYPFYNYYIRPRDGLSFKNAMFYTYVSGNNGYTSETGAQNRYFLIDLQRDVQYLFYVSKYGDQWWSYRLDISMYYANDYIQKQKKCKTQQQFDSFIENDNYFTNYMNNNLLFQEYLEENDDWEYRKNISFYLKITSNVNQNTQNIKIYKKDSQNNENIIGSYDLNIDNSAKFCVKVYSPIAQFSITPNPKKFIDSTNRFAYDNDYNRQEMIFVKKNSDTKSLGLNTRGLFPTKNLVFYFDFQNAIKSKTSDYEINVLYRSVYGNYQLNSYSYNDYYANNGYLYQTNGFRGNGCYLGSDGYDQQSNFQISYNFTNFALMYYVCRDYSSYGDYNGTTPTLVSYGYQSSQYQQDIDSSNRNKGFGFYMQSGYIGIRIGDRKYLMDQIKLNIGQWYHVCMTWNGNYLCGYINGVLQIKKSIVEIQREKLLEDGWLSATKFYIGTSCDYKNQHYNSWSYAYGYKLDEIACFSQCLSDFYIETIYNSGAVL